jgi:lysophospholipase L1-like esterase
VILMLGTNDLHLPFRMEKEHLGDGIRELIEVIQSIPNCGQGFVAPKILVMAPAEIRPSAPEGRVSVYPKFYGDWGRELSLAFPEVYEKVAEEKGCYFLNAGLYAEPGGGDGVHFTPESHVRLGKAVAEKVKEIFA